MLAAFGLAGALSAASPAPVASPAPAQGYVSAYSEYDSHFADIFNNAYASWNLGKGALFPFAALDVDYDTRSGVPGVSEIYGENAIVPRAGFRWTLDPGEYASAFATAGYSFGLRSQPSFPEVRYGVEYARDYGSQESAHPNASLSANVTDYSRYQGNAIGEAAFSFEAPLLHPVRLLTGVDLSIDEHREYGNNYAEAYAGLSWPFAPAFALQADALAGEYLPRGIGVPSPRSYTGLRVRLEFARDLPAP